MLTVRITYETMFEEIEVKLDTTCDTSITGDREGAVTSAEKLSAAALARFSGAMRA